MNIHMQEKNLIVSSQNWLKIELNVKCKTEKSKDDVGENLCGLCYHSDF